MGLNHSPRIVTDGLVLCLDAANKKSYPGSGTTWNDLSGNGRNFTLVNSPTYTGGNDGNISFDGVNDHATLSGWNWPSTTSISFFIQPISAPGGTYSRIFSTGGSDNFEIAINSSRQLSYYTATNAWNTAILTIDATWNHITFSQSGTALTIYKNGVSSYTGSLTTSAGTSLYIGARYTGPSEYSNVKLSHIAVYNKTLSATEVKQNFNALRGRFGL